MTLNLIDVEIAERQVLRALVQNPLAFWPQAAVLRDEDFHHFRKLFEIIRTLILSNLDEGRVPKIQEQTLHNVVHEMALDIEPGDVSALFESFHPEKFISGINVLVGTRTLTPGEFSQMDVMKKLCTRAVVGETSVSPAFGEVSPTASEWLELIPIAGPEPEPMRSDDFPPCVGKIVQAVVEHAEVPVELPGLMALGVLATAAQKKYEIACDGSHKEPLNLFVCPALDPGNRKTSVVSILTGPLRRWERDQRAELAPAIREAESHRQTALKRIEVIRAKAAKSDDPIERDDLQKEIDEIERDLPHVQTMPLLTTDDCTPEHVATLLSHHGERLAIVSDEGGIFDIVAGRYSRGVPNLDVFLQSHAGSPVRVHRGSRDPVDLQNPCLTVAVSCQPFVLEEMGSNKAFRGRGLLARFLFAIPKSNLGFRSLQPSEIPSPQLDAWNYIVCTMLDREQHVDDYGNAKSQILYLAPEAYQLWKSEQYANEIDMRPGGSWAENTGWASKYPGAVLRIAGVLHCAVCTSVGQDPAAVDVAESTMRFALQLGRKIKSHSRQAFGMMALTDDQKFANKVVDWIQRDGITEFTGRECSIHCNSAGSVKELDGAFDLLITHGWIRTGQKKQPDGGGRPSLPFEVNPAVAQLDDNTDKTIQPVNGHGVSSVLSVLSSVSAQRVLRPVLPVEVDAYDFKL